MRQFKMPSKKLQTGKMNVLDSVDLLWESTNTGTLYTDRENIPLAVDN